MVTFFLVAYPLIGFSLFLFLLCNREWRWLNMLAAKDWVLAPLFFMCAWPWFLAWCVSLIRN